MTISRITRALYGDFSKNLAPKKFFGKKLKKRGVRFFMNNFFISSKNSYVTRYMNLYMSTIPAHTAKAIVTAEVTLEHARTPADDPLAHLQLISAEHRHGYRR